MSQNIQNVNLAVISQRTLETLLPLLLPIRAFAADFSAEIMNAGESVKTRRVVKGTATSYADGFTASDANTDPITITLGDPQGYGVGFSDAEISKSSIDLNRIFVKPAAAAVADKIQADLFALVASTTGGSGGTPVFSNTPLAVNAADFSADNVADLAQSLTALNVPKDGRVLVLTPSFYGALAKDPGVKYAYAYGSPTGIQDNKIPRIHGFDIHESTLMPTGLNGFASWSEALCIAARQPATPQNWYGEVQNVVDPQSNVALQFRFFYDGIAQKHYLNVQSLYGVAAGTTDALIRIVPA